jgi:ribosome-binding protein aMBF1 (putative translation factor)
MPKVSTLRSARQVHAEDLRDPEVREEYRRTALAHAVAMRVLRYRTDHGLSQSALGRQLGMAQSAIARMEAGDHEPSLDMLVRLSRGLALEFHIEITPSALELRESA